jgi:hypothetical protein
VFHYPQHIIFEPISAWESFVAHCLVAASVLSLLAGLFCGAFTVSYLRAHIKGWR